MIHALQEGLNKVDQFPIYTPNLQWFEKLILAEQQHERKRLKRDLSVFLFVAFFILSGIIISLYQMPVVFFIVQIISTGFIAIYIGTRFVKKVNNG